MAIRLVVVGFTTSFARIAFISVWFFKVPTNVAYSIAVVAPQARLSWLSSWFSLLQFRIFLVSRDRHYSSFSRPGGADARSFYAFSASNISDRLGTLS